MVERNFGLGNNQKNKPEATPEKNGKQKNELRIEGSQNNINQPNLGSSPRFGGVSFVNPLNTDHMSSLPKRQSSIPFQEPNLVQNFASSSVPYEESKNELPIFGMPPPPLQHTSPTV